MQDVCDQFSTLQVGPNQPDPRPTPNPNPNVLPLGGSRSAAAVTRLLRLFWWRFFFRIRNFGRPKAPGGRKASVDQSESHPAQKFVPTAPANRAASRAARAARGVYPVAKTDVLPLPWLESFGQREAISCSLVELRNCSLTRQSIECTNKIKIRVLRIIYI